MKTNLQTSEAFASWKGRAAKWMSFRVYAEAKDMELARTRDHGNGKCIFTDMQKIWTRGSENVSGNSER